MARSRRSTRHTYTSNPSGILSIYPSGYGFVRTSEGEYFVPRAKIHGAFDGDLVEIIPLSQKSSKSNRGGAGNRHPQDRPAAQVCKILDRAHEVLIGRFSIAEPFGVVVPLDAGISHDIFTPLKDAQDIPEGALVKVRIINYPTRHSAATGEIIEMLGMADSSDGVIEGIITQHKLETSFSAQALMEASTCTLDAQGALSSGYVDIRNRVIFTIDPSDAKDFDDAVSLELVSDIDASDVNKPLSSQAYWRLGVHIADVAYFVSWDSSIDLDARRRATSVYLADRVLPMLPNSLSEDLCSLKPHEDRRCITVDLFLDKSAHVVGSTIYLSLINSQRRFTYDEVLHLLNPASGDPAAHECDSFFTPILAQLSHIAQLRRNQRKMRGAPDFDSAEAKVVLNSQKEPVDVVLKTKNCATELIEEAMLMANEAVATFLLEKGISGIFRNHEKPLSINIAPLIPLFSEFEWFNRVDAQQLLLGDTFAIQKTLELSKHRPEETLVSSHLLRAMPRAVYSPSNTGHFGLALDNYLHFTSPIRRYPDLIVHRALHWYFNQQRVGVLSSQDKKDQMVQAAQLSWIAQHASDMERISADAAQESTEYMMTVYMQQFIGSKFSAIISGVSHHGIFVRLDNTLEGFIPLRYLGDEYFVFDSDKGLLTGEDSGTLFRMGKRIVVLLYAVSPQTRHVEFRLV